MKIIWGIVTALVQFIAGYLAIFILVFIGLSALLEALGLVGPDNVNPWWNTPLQFTSFALAAALGVWGVGWPAANLRKTDFNRRKAWWGALAGSALGMVIAAFMSAAQGAVGFLPVTLALVGALAGYYLYPYVWK